MATTVSSKVFADTLSALSERSQGVLIRDGASREANDICTEDEVTEALVRHGVVSAPEVLLFEQTFGGLVATLDSRSGFSLNYEFGVRFSLRHEQGFVIEDDDAGKLVRVGLCDRCELYLDGIGHLWAADEDVARPWELASSVEHFLEQLCLLHFLETSGQVRFYVKVAPGIGTALATSRGLTAIPEVEEETWCAWEGGGLIVVQAFGRRDPRAKGSTVYCRSVDLAAEIVTEAIDLVTLDELCVGGVGTATKIAARPKSERNTVPRPESWGSCTYSRIYTSEPLKNVLVIHGTEKRIEQYALSGQRGSWDIMTWDTLDQEGCLHRTFFLPG